MRTIQIEIDTNHDHLCGNCAFVRDDKDGGGRRCAVFGNGWLGYHHFNAERLSACLEAERKAKRDAAASQHLRRLISEGRKICGCAHPSAMGAAMAPLLTPPGW